MIGPSLPEHLRKKNTDETTTPTNDKPNEQGKDTSAPSKPSVTGPQLPPHLLAAREAKRKRKREEEEQKQKDEGIKEANHSPHQPATAPPTQQYVGPSLPSKAPPPRHQTSGHDSDSDDSDIGPSLSAMMTPAEAEEYAQKQAIAALTRQTTQDETNKSKGEPKLQRDSWMLAPPSRADWLGTLDASKLKARTFNQSRSGTLNQSGEADHTVWTETPLERAQRLEDEALGRKPAKAAKTGKEKRDHGEDEERDRRIKEYTQKTRGPALMERHKAAGTADEDDPSKRAFDYQKDIAGGTTLGFKQRESMINRAKTLDSKFARGKNL